MASYEVTDDDQSVTASAFSDSIQVDGDRDTIMAGEGDDHVYATGFNEIIHGEMGADDLHDQQAGSSDLLDGGIGNDKVYGYWSDTLIGGDGTDTFFLSVSGLGSGISADFSTVGSGSEDLVFSWGELTGFEAGTFGGTTHDDTLKSSSAADLTVFGDDGNDVIVGAGGKITPNSGPENLIGGAGDDLITAGAGPAQMYAFDNGGLVETALGVGQAVDSETDHDTLRGGDFGDTLFAGYGFETLIGGGGTDAVAFLYLTHASVNIRLDKGHGGNSDGGHYALKTIESVGGTPLDDRLTGSDGVDTLNGREGDDTLTGGLGADKLDGGLGDNLFIYRSTADSTPAAYDIIGQDGGVTIDLHAIDAKTDKAGNQKFTLVDSFTHHSGELISDYDFRSNEATVLGDVDGDGTADFKIVVEGGAGDFVL